MKMHQKNKTGKKPVLGAIIAVTCIAIYLFALAQAAVRIYISIDERRITADREFNRIATLAYTTGLQGFMDETFTQTITNALNSSTSIEALIITGPVGEYAFEKQKDYAVSWVNNSPRFRDRFTLSKQDLYMPLSLPEVRNANIKGIASTFDTAGITGILKQTLLIILIGFAFSFFTILLQTLLGKQTASGHVYTPFDKLKKDTKEEITKNTTEDELPGRQIELPQEIITEEEEETKPATPYSNRSNIGWEQNISNKLDDELHLCSSTENDLAFLLIELIDVSNDDLFIQSVDEAVDSFGTREMFFEYGRWGFAAILPGTSLEEAITSSEKYCQKIMEKYPRSFSSSALNIGITSRSGRLLKADRIIMEAAAALKKAKSESTTSIIAFKSDPDKYREFIRKHS